jgi:protein-tyrosine-phosphatase
VAESRGGGGDDRVRRLLFVCTGNTCRSPMAEAVARRLAERRGMELEVRSAGTSAAPGSPASRGAYLAARDRGLELSGHESTPLTGELAGWADLVVCMTEAHRERAATLAEAAGRTRLLTEFLPGDHPRAGRDVPDPVGRSLDVYRETLEVLEEAVGRLLDRVEEGGARGAEGE